MRLLFISFLIGVSGIALAQDSIAVRFSKTVTSQDLKKHLSILASDEYEGRETGQKGQKMSAEYIKKQFETFGIPPIQRLNGYLQQFDLAVYQPQKVEVNLNGKIYEDKKDLYTFSSIVKDSTFSISEIVFAGYGINKGPYNDYAGLNVKGKSILIINGEPYSKEGKSLISGTEKPSDWTTNFRMKLFEAQRQGAAFVFVVDRKLVESYEANEHRINSTKMSIDLNGAANFAKPFFFYISEKMANEIINSKKKNIETNIKKISEKGKAKSFVIKTNLLINVKQERNKINTENVLGYIEGTDLKNELVVITAHYDHLGKHDGVVYNGADDDGSGTVAVIELAQAFAEAKKAGKGPRRSMLFMTVSGEEKGLLGSDYYTRNPVFPLASTVCDLNIDMIGRLDEKHKSNANYIYLIGADKISKELHDINEAMNTKYTNLELDYTYNDEKDPNRYYYRSDHYNFAKNGIPVIFYFNGVHEDYHQETDEVSKIDFDKMQKISRLVFFTAWEVANKNDRLMIDKK